MVCEDVNFVRNTDLFKFETKSGMSEGVVVLGSEDGWRNLILATQILVLRNDAIV
jgi:hypothetical protein